MSIHSGRGEASRTALENKGYSFSPRAPSTMPPQVQGFVLHRCYKVSVFPSVIKTLPAFSHKFRFFVWKGCMQGRREFSQKKKICMQLNQKDILCSEIGQDKTLNFKTFSKWVYITFYSICPDYFSGEQPKKPHFSGPSCFSHETAPKVCPGRRAREQGTGPLWTAAHREPVS